MLKLPAFDQGKILVVGDVMLDRYWSGGTTRVSPEAPVPVVQLNQTEDRAGGAGNVALNLAALGAEVKLIGVVGCDEAGQQLSQTLEKAGVSAELVDIPEAQTITKLRVISRNQQLMRLDVDGNYKSLNLDQLTQRVAANLADTDLLVLSDYDKGTLQNVDQLISLAKALSIPVVIDPKGCDFQKYRGATVITPNMSEFVGVVGESATEDSLCANAEKLRVSLELDALLLTRSEKGVSLFHQDSAFHLPTKAQEVFDVTGAGDTVVAVLAACLAVKTPWHEAVTLANMAAGLAVGKFGAVSVSPIELQATIESAQALRIGDSGLTDVKVLKKALADAHARGEKIVMTNGCFDILHPGHIRYLQQARNLGDRLIVAINSDQSVKRLKGESRPVNHLQDRALMLSALRAVNWVVEFEEDTPAELIADVLPDVLVKGGDYSIDQIAGADSVIKSGGDVKVLTFVEGYSTTGFIERIKEPK